MSSITTIVNVDQTVPAKWTFFVKMEPGLKPLLAIALSQKLFAMLAQNGWFPVKKCAVVTISYVTNVLRI